MKFRMRNEVNKLKLSSWAKKNLSLFLLVAMFPAFSLSVFAGESRIYENERLELVKYIEAILIDAKLCKSKQDCQQKKYFFVSPGRNGLSIKTYGITSRNVLSGVASQSLVLFYSIDYMDIEIENFSFSKDEDLSSFFGKGSPSYSLKLKKEK